MKILKETKFEMVSLEMDMSEAEKVFLKTHAIKNIGNIKLDELLIEWALVDILSKAVKEIKPSKKKNAKVRK